MVWLAPALLIAAIIGAYANTLRAPFVYDDGPAILENASIRRLGDWRSVLLPPREGGLTVSGRPVLNLSLALNYAVSGPDPWSYHVFNVLVHAGAALLLFGIVRRSIAGWRIARGGPKPETSGSAVLALLVAGLWALHPLATQAVTYTVQRAESLAAFFYLLTLYGFVRATGPAPSSTAKASSARGRAWLVLSVVACAFGMATKEIVVTAPVLVWLFDRTFVAGTFRAALRARWSYYLALGSTWLLLAALLATTGWNRGGTVGLGVAVPWWAYPLTQFEALTRYLVLTGWPQSLAFEYGTFWAARVRDVLPYALLVLPALAVTIWALWPRHDESVRTAPVSSRAVAGFLGAWFFGILAPTSLAPGTLQMIVEHRAYLPLASVTTGVALVGWRLIGRHAIAPLALVAVALLLLTVARNALYQSHLALWSDTVAKRPENPRARASLAEAYEELGQLDRAIAERRECVRLKPEEPTYHHNLAVALAAAGRDDEAMRHYELALRLDPAQPRTQNNLAVLLVRRGEVTAALPHYDEALRLQPNDPQYHYNLGNALLAAGRPAEAAAQFEATLRVRPGDADAQLNLGTALLRTGEAPRALESYAAALRARPNDADFHLAYGNVLLALRRASEAESEFRAALTLRPDFSAAHFSLAGALAAQGNIAAAIAQYEALLAREPAHGDAQFMLANLLVDQGRAADAVPHYEAAVRANPRDAEAHHNLGAAYARLERWRDAEREFEAALRLKPDYVEARQHLLQVRQLLAR